MPPSRQTRESKQAAARPAAATAGYDSNAAHLFDHLKRIDLLVKAQVLRWRASIAAGKPENMWGMVHVTDTEVHAFLRSSPGASEEFPEETQKELADLWAKAASLAEAIAAAEAATPDKAQLRLLQLQESFSLSDTGRDVLLTCLLPEQDARYRRMFGYLQDDASRTQPTVELVASILSRDGNGLEAMRPCLDAGRPLCKQNLLVMRNRTDEPLPVRSLRLDDRIAAFLLGSDALDARLEECVTVVDSLGYDDLTVDPQHLEKLRDIERWWNQRSAGQSAVMLFRGVYGSGQQASAQALSGSLGMPLLVVEVDRALRGPAPWDEMVGLAFREATLRGAALYWAGCETLLARDQPAARWEQLLTGAEAFRGLVFLASSVHWEPAGHSANHFFLHLEFGIPGYALRCRLWETRMPGAEEFAKPVPDRKTLGNDLAMRYQITEGQIEDAIRAARAIAVFRNAGLPLLRVEDLFEGCRKQASRRLVTFSRRVEPRLHLEFSDLILPQANLRQLREVQDRIRTAQRVQSQLGLEEKVRFHHSMVVLFTGASGTGKTMAAEWLARQLRVDLYKADSAAITSKWVGETEKNLHQLFLEAEGSNAILFFDEADALFGKRGEVKDARDRWANNEVNYLLQKIEEFAGVVILASNLRQNIDEAFVRRISATVDFPAPDEAARVRIWQGMFPRGLERPSDEEVQSIAARVKLSGGSIRNIVVDATFRAAADQPEGKPAVTLRHLVLASAREYQKLGRPLTKSEFGDVFYGWLEEDVL